MTVTGHTVIYGVPTKDLHLLFPEYKTMNDDERYGLILGSKSCTIDGITFDVIQLPHDQEEDLCRKEKIRFFDYLMEEKLLSGFSSDDEKSQKLAELLCYELVKGDISKEKRQQWISDELFVILNSKGSRDDRVPVKGFVDTYLPERSTEIHKKFPSVYFESCDEWDRSCMIVGVKLFYFEKYALGSISMDDFHRAEEIYKQELDSLGHEKFPVFFEQEPKIYFVQDDCGCCS